MFALRILLAAGSITLINGAPVSSSHSLESRNPSTYVEVFAGTGAVSQGWPSVKQWTASFDDMFTASLPILSKSCAQYPGSPANNNPSENNDLRSAIETVAAESGVDARFIFAVVMQESNGCVRAPTTNYGVTNPGLMQSHNGAGSCNNGNIQNPCPLSEITTMIRDGTEGTQDGDGLKQLLAKSGSDGDSKYYIAARMYNSGSVAPSGNLGDGIATHCYASDIANRLVGWSTGVTGCNGDNIGTLPVVNALFRGAVSNSDPAPAPPAPAPPAPPAPTKPDVPSPSAGVFVEKQAEPSPTTAVVVPVPKPVDTEVDAPHTGTTKATVSPTEPNLHAVTSGGSGHALAAGTPCSNEGQWNCINTSSFQQCASGTWSVVQNLAEGTVCKAGQSAAIQITNARKRRSSHLSPAHVLKHARHASF